MLILALPAKRGSERVPKWAQIGVQKDPQNGGFFRDGRKLGKHLFDLSAYIRYQLVIGGVEQISQLESDTCAEEEKFFSYRRSVLNGEDNYGREISIIAIA